ncbi:MAG: UDP-glucose 4-epimerase GalE [Candidatus Doudnabacteria bacterium]|nr:UDP-glucose 4-epimerase GalE [Candidatus Doudnabacteria bacterium]
MPHAFNSQEIEDLLAKNNGQYLVFENDQPKFVVLDPVRYPHFVNFDKNRPNVLVTGGAGYIGSHVVLELLAANLNPIIIDNLSNCAVPNLGCPFIVGDLEKTEVLDKVFEQYNIQAVVHLAGSIIVEESVLLPEKYFHNNVVAGINLLNTMLRHGVNKLIYSSSAAVYGSPRYVPIDENHATEPLNPYGETKLIFEKIVNWYVKAHDLNAVMFRYFNAAGADPHGRAGEKHFIETHLIPRVFQVANKELDSVKIFGHDYPTADGTAIRDYVHVADIAKAHALAIAKLEEDTGSFTYNIGTGKGYSVQEIVDKVVEVTERMVPIEQHERRAGDPPILVADSKKAQKELGLELKHSDLDTIIRTAWNWHKQAFAKPAVPVEEKAEETAST